MKKLLGLFTAASEEIKALEDTRVFNSITFISLGHERDLSYGDNDTYKCSKCGMVFKLAPNQIPDNVDNMCPETIVLRTMEE